MPGSLTVELNRDRLHDVDVVGSFATSGPFTVDLNNNGGAVHVHLHLDDDLSRVASLAAGNHYVEPNATRPVEVSVAQVDEPVSGKLKVVTGHGTETEYVTVTVEPPPEGAAAGTSDEGGGNRQSSTAPEKATGTGSALGGKTQSGAEAPVTETVRDLLAPASMPVLALAVAAVLVAIGTATVVSSLPVLLGVTIVFAGVVVALWLVFG
ncbi:MAG: hypothetical protein ABEJ22_06985 [Haloferacaceae archaeon]